MDVVKQQLYLSNADGDRVFDDSDYGLATKLLEEKFLEKVNGYEEGKYTPVVTETLSFSRDIGAEPEINVEKIFDERYDKLLEYLKLNADINQKFAAIEYFDYN